MFNIKVRQIDDVAIVYCTGKLVEGEAILVLKEAVTTRIEMWTKKIILNLRDVPYIDSTGIGEIVSAFTSVRNRGGDLKLLLFPGNIKYVLFATRLIQIFEIFEDEEKAVKSFHMRDSA